MNLFDQFLAVLSGNVVFVAAGVTAILWLVGNLRIRGSLLKSNKFFSGLWPLAAAALGVAFCFFPGVMDDQVWGELVLNGIVSGLMAAIFIRAKVIMRVIDKVKKSGDHENAK